MPSLVVDLQSGFADETVEIRVNGQELFRKEGVTTDYSIGRADSVEVELAEGSAKVEVAVPSRQISSQILLEVRKTVFLGLSILDDKIDFRVSDEMFLYF